MFKYLKLNKIKFFKMSYVVLENNYKLPFYESLSLKFSNSLRNYVEIKQLNDGNVLVTSSDIKFNNNSIPLQRSSSCSFVALKQRNETNLPLLKHKWIAVACVAIIEKNDCVLLTRRTSHLQAFPNLWVCPGGHVDSGETLENAALRELAEETGIELSEENADISLLCAWESSFPSNLHIGMPKSHHLVLYFKVVAKHKEFDMEKLLVNTDEVSAYAWINKNTIAEIILSFKDPIDLKWMNNNEEKKDDYFESYEVEMVDNQLEYHQATRPVTVLIGSVSNIENVERVSTGTKFALYEWLKSYVK